MQLINQFEIPLGVSEAWTLLTDVEKIAHCMPGAELTSVQGDKFTGTIKIKVGPVSVLFEGKAAFIEKNVRERRAVISVDGADTKGQGYAKGTITASLSSLGRKKSLVTFETDVTLSGRMASFGRNTMTDISDKLFNKFASCVETELLGGGG